MRFQQHLVPGRLLRRYKRFLADIRLDDGTEVVAHCANPGSMKTCLQEGARVWLSPAQNPKRKLRWTWEWTEFDDVRIFVNPVRANDVVFGAIKRGLVPELAGYDLLQREVTTGASRIDGLLRGTDDCYVEVKNVTLGCGQGVSAFPDSPTVRGRKHIKELMRLRAAGKRAVLFFLAARDDTECVRPADEIDPDYGEILRQGAAAGVELLAYRCVITTKEIVLSARVPVVLPN